jgi:hypothetical protein
MAYLPSARPMRLVMRRVEVMGCPPSRKNTVSNPPKVSESNGYGVLE